MNFKNQNSLPLPVLLIGGAILGFAVAWILVNVLSGFIMIAGPILGLLWGLSLYKKPVR